MVLGIFVSLATFYTVVWWTLVRPMTLLRVVVLMGLTGPAIGLLWPKVRMGMEHLEWLFFNVLAVGPLLMCSFLWLNYAAHGEVMRTDHPIADIQNSSVRRGRQGTLVRRSAAVVDFRLADDFLAEYPFALRTWREMLVGHGDTLSVGTATGLFGVAVVVDQRMH